MRPFRKVNPQLACRSVDDHFPRYNLLSAEDCQIFRSVLWALQRQLPVEEEPLLVQNHWEFLYARSIGCIGLLKLHLNRALNLALTQGAKTVTEAHLRQTAMPDARVKLAMRNALESEAEFAEAEDADEQLLAELRRPFSQASSQTQETPGQNKQAPSTGKKRRVGARALGRDPIQMDEGDGAAHSSVAEGQKAG